MGIKQAIESMVGVQPEEPTIAPDRPKRKRSRREIVRQAIELLEDERDELVEDVNGDVSLIGGERLATYNMIDKVINKLSDHLK